MIVCAISADFRERQRGILYVSRARRVILTDSRYATQAQEESTDFEVLEINRQAGYPVSLAKMVSEDGGKKHRL